MSETRILGTAKVEMLAVSFRMGRAGDVQSRICLKIGDGKAKDEEGNVLQPDIFMFPERLRSAGLDVPTGGLKDDILAAFEKSAKPKRRSTKKAKKAVGDAQL
jgi:hypothetical protein